ncbi:cytochrome b [Paraherbaspirillum soli]|uniref:Cytochrome b n=1 Tax=Paraherbaspirillum soli TaxID=631222 RepID=A0ABW0MBV6_9BURK
MKTINKNRYSWPLVGIHWLTVLLMLAILFSAELRHVLVERGGISMRSVMVLHIGCGVALLALTVIRLAVRLLGRRMPPAPGGSRFEHAAAHAVHLAIYALLLAEPLIGWIIVNAKGMAIPMPLLGFDLPILVPRDTELVTRMVMLHEILGRVFYATVALHGAAALWHHFVKRDGIIYRMWWKTKPQDQRQVRAPLGGSANDARAFLKTSKLEHGRSAA